MVSCVKKEMNNPTEPILQGKYRHYRNGRLYQVIALARHSETHEPMVVYQAQYTSEEFGHQQIWVRPQAMFLESVLHEGKHVPRFVFEGM